MAKIKTYNLIKTLLEDNPELRDSDKKLIWAVWERLDFVSYEGYNSIPFIYSFNFMDAPSTETIRRCRQKVQENHPELRSSKKVQQLKDEIQRQKGTHVYREEISFSETVKEQLNLI